MVQIALAGDEIMQATRVDPQHPWVCWATNSLSRTTGMKPAIPAQSRRFAARRRLFGFAWPNDGVGTTYLSRLLGPRSERASTDCPRPGSAADHGRPLLGPWRSRNTGERSALERRSWSIMNSSHRSGRAAGLRCRCVTQPPSAPHPTEVRFEGWSRATTRKPAPKWAAPTQSRRLSASPTKEVIINVPGVIAE